MENIISRHRNLSILAVVLFAQILGLAVQVKRGTDQGSARLIRVWAVSAITPFAKGVVHTSSWFTDNWHEYVYLRGVRAQNEQLRDEIQRMRLEQVRMSQDASQARRLQTLLGFKEQFISQTMAAQVISTTGSEFSRGIYIDKGSRDGIKPDMPVITSDGIVGKILRVYPTSSLVLEINDPSSGAGVILEKSRLQGILKGSPSGEAFVANVMADEKVEVGERILSSGGDRVYPKGLTVGTVARVRPAGTFLNVEVRPAAQLSRLEEVLVITKVVEKAPDVNDQIGPIRAIDILAERLPSVPPKPPDAPKPGTAGAITAAKPPATTAEQKPNVAPTVKPAIPAASAGQEKIEKKPATPAEAAGQAKIEKKPQASTSVVSPTTPNAGLRPVPPAGAGQAAIAKAPTVEKNGNQSAATEKKPATPPADKSGNGTAIIKKQPPDAAANTAKKATAKAAAEAAKPENSAKDTPR